MKKSKLQRKFVNQMRGMGEVPWPARRFKYPPTAALFGKRHITLAVTCTRPIGEVKARAGRFKRKRPVAVPCGGKLIAKLGRSGGRRIYCESCRARKRQLKLNRRIELQLKSRFGIEPRQQAREERRTSRMLAKLAKFRSAGSR